jgi:hypothetical protein
VDKLDSFQLKKLEEKMYAKKSKNSIFDIEGLEKSYYRDPDEVKKDSFSADR